MVGRKTKEGNVINNPVTEGDRGRQWKSRQRAEVADDHVAR